MRRPTPGDGDEVREAPVIVNGDGSHRPVRDGDAILFFNFRADRAREITRASPTRVQGLRPEGRPSSPPTCA